MSAGPEDLELDEAATDAAIEAATEAFRAGDDEQGQLIAAIKAYLWSTGVRTS